VTVAGKHYVIATQSGYIVDNVTGYPEEFATKQSAVKALSELVHDAAERCRRSYKTCSVVGTARDGDVKIRVGGRQGYHLWDRYTISERAGARKARAAVHHAEKKSPAQLQREIDEILANPSSALEAAVSKARAKADESNRRQTVWRTENGEFRVRPMGEKVNPLWWFVRHVPSEAELRR
jgi:hypothetical protein